MSVFQKATKKGSKLRLAICGPAGSGKTYSSLAIASGLGGRIALIDTEHKSASKYADEFEFDTVPLTDFDPRLYVEMIRAAEAEGYGVVIIDSLSHAWSGTGGALDLVDRAKNRSASKNAYTEGWREVTPLHNRLVETILACRCHVIATMRVKVEYILEENSRGAKIPRKVGMAPIQREGMDFEFDVVGDIDATNTLRIGKTRYKALNNQDFNRPGSDLGRKLAAWLSDGEATQEGGAPAPTIIRPSEPVPDGFYNPTREPILPDQVATIRDLAAKLGYTEDKLTAAAQRRGADRLEDLSETEGTEIINKMATALDAKGFPANVEPAPNGQADPAPDGVAEGPVPEPDGQPVNADVTSHDSFVIPDAERADRPVKKGKKSAK